MHGESELESQLRSMVIKAGGFIEDAGRSYNAALTLFGITPAFGLLLFLGNVAVLGIGVVVAVVAINASIVHVSGANSLNKRRDETHRSIINMHLNWKFE